MGVSQLSMLWKVLYCRVTQSTSTDSMTNDTQAKSSTAAVSASPLSPTTAVTSSSSSATVSTQTTTKAGTKPVRTTAVCRALGRGWRGVLQERKHE